MNPCCVTSFAYSFGWFSPYIGNKQIIVKVELPKDVGGAVKRTTVCLDLDYSFPWGHRQNSQLGWGRRCRCVNSLLCRLGPMSSKQVRLHPPWTPWNRRCCGSSLVSNTIHLLKSYPRPSCWYGSLALHYCNSPSASFSLKPHSHQVVAGFERRRSSMDGGTTHWNSIGAMWSIVTVWTVVNIPHFTVDVVVLHLRVCIYGYIWIIVVRGQVEKY